MMQPQVSPCHRYVGTTALSPKPRSIRHPAPGLGMYLNQTAKIPVQIRNVSQCGSELDSACDTPIPSAPLQMTISAPYSGTASPDRRSDGKRFHLHATWCQAMLQAGRPGALQRPEWLRDRDYLIAKKQCQLAVARLACATTVRTDAAWQDALAQTEPLIARLANSENVDRQISRQLLRLHKQHPLEIGREISWRARINARLGYADIARTTALFVGREERAATAWAAASRHLVELSPTCAEQLAQKVLQKSLHGIHRAQRRLARRAGQRTNPFRQLLSQASVEEPLARRLSELVQRMLSDRACAAILRFERSFCQQLLKAIQAFNLPHAEAQCRRLPRYRTDPGAVISDYYHGLEGTVAPLIQLQHALALQVQTFNYLSPATLAKFEGQQTLHRRLIAQTIEQAMLNIHQQLLRQSFAPSATFTWWQTLWQGLRGREEEVSRGKRWLKSFRRHRMQLQVLGQHLELQQRTPGAHCNPRVANAALGSQEASAVTLQLDQAWQQLPHLPADFSWRRPLYSPFSATALGIAGVGIGAATLGFAAGGLGATLAGGLLLAVHCYTAFSRQREVQRLHRQFHTLARECNPLWQPPTTYAAHRSPGRRSKPDAERIPPHLPASVPADRPLQTPPPAQWDP